MYDTAVIRYAKRSYERSIVENFKQNPKDFWSYIRDQTKVRKGVHDLKNEDGEVVTTDLDKANLLNAFFCVCVCVGTRRTFARV